MQQSRLEHGLGQFLHEQWHPVGLDQDLGQHFLRQAALTGHASDQFRCLAAAHAVESQGANVRVSLSLPARPELGPVGDQQHHRQLLQLRYQKIERLLAGGVDPVHVFVDNQDRLPPGQCFDLSHKRPQRLLLLLLR